MQFAETFNSALTSLKSNKIRAFLTTLGVIIGVFSVVTLISLGQGIQNYITDEFNALGSNLLFISPGKAGLSEDPAQSFTNNKLDERHIDLIKRYAADIVTGISPMVISGESIKYKSNTYFAEAIGVSYNGTDIVNYEIDKGRMFTRAEEKSNAQVAIVGQDIIKNLFKGSNPIGNSIKMGNSSYEIIGTFKSKGSNYDDQFIAPYTSLMSDLEIKNFATIMIKVKSVDTTNIRKLEIAMLNDLDKEEFTVLSQQDLLDSISQVLGAITAGLGLIAGISLLVGGIGIMNIMLVSVTERTREIGLRKALGATSKNIVIQFISESVVISFVGGLIGLLLGFVATLLAQQFLRAQIPIYAVFLAFGFSALVGVVFGTYPAVKASKKDPIEALRFE